MTVNTYDSIWKAVLFTVLAVGICLIVWYATHWVRAQARIGTERAHEATGEHNRLRSLCNTQGAVIDAFINELAMRPKTYETMPDDLKNAFYAAHEGARLAGNGREQHH